MATRRRIGVSAATTEAARRQLMLPVPCWGKAWVTPNVTTGSSLKVYKWIKTDKVQQFSDDEGEVDEPLAPLPDEPEGLEGDDDLEQDEPRNDPTQVKDLVELDVNQDDVSSKVPSPKPQLMMMESAPDEDAQDSNEVLDQSLQPLNTTIIEGDDIGKDMDVGINDLGLDLSGLGGDGLQLEETQDLSLDGPDGIIGGPLMDDGGDPFLDST